MDDGLSAESDFDERMAGDQVTRLIPAALSAAVMLTYSAGPALCQDANSIDAKTAVILENARRAYAAQRPQKRCDTSSSSDEIVVCAPDHGERWCVPSTSEEQPSSRQAVRDGRMHAPALDRGSCRGQAGCITGGWAPPPVYYIDMKAIPEPPPGSDADKIAKGEMLAP
ncbi:hypothetical protein [Novosphingobium sp. JCM 18896]|uniref:hypothetical protein n=1 Tax=Novosphingobium sp. JCM 18896 TaxID=2989731 RepID=UPI0022227994|nr:hypothetical protein [Novosphingobium sp. JCM 18896]MCW1429936.1 hypothetical protein [Novosphingobium sp. JCM 18896]